MIALLGREAVLPESGIMIGTGKAGGGECTLDAVRDFPRCYETRRLTGCGKLGLHAIYYWSLPYWHRWQQSRRMLKKAVQQGRSERRGEAYASVR